MAETAVQTGNRVDPYRSYNFKLEIQGVAQGHFTEVSDIQVEVENIRYREGGLNQVVHCIPGLVNYGHVTLRYGMTSSTDLWEWFNKVLEGNVERKNCSIVVLQSDGATPGLRWDLIDCWPSAWRAAPLDALGNEIAIESLTLAFETLQRS